MMHPFTPKAALRMPLVALIFALALIAAGCGGGNTSAPTPFIVTGTLEDTTGTPISGDTVEVDGNVAEETTTGASGVFSVSVLPATLFVGGVATQHTISFYNGPVSTADLAQSVTLTISPSEATAAGVQLGAIEIGPPAVANEPAVRAG